MNENIKEIIQNRIEDIYQSGEYIYQAKELEEILNYITNLQNKYEKALQILVDSYMPCELECGDDNFMDIHCDWCEKNCSNDEEQFKKCWDKFIEWKLKDD